ncbi:hypothetical protein BDF19DRAFT_41897 [Syncephalis fuscata]|nr:hypothetical protein BDF19DRAFT_41897 [Syncephalis fuscata]
MSTLARPMHYQQAAPEIASLARQSGVPRPEHQGWLRRQTLGPVKVWKRRWFILKDGQLFSSKTPSAERIKPVVSIAGCRITPDPNANPGYYGFRITPSNKHPDRRVQLFCYDDEDATKAWIKCLMKATIGRDFNAPVVSSCTVATVPLNVARDMAPRPPSAVFSGSPVSPVSPQQPNADNWGLPNINSEPFAGGNAEGDWPQTVGNQMVSPPLSKPVSASFISPQEQVFNTGMYPHQQTAYEQPGLRGRPVSATNDAPVGQRVSGFMRSNQEGGEDKRQIVAKNGYHSRGNSVNRTLL